MAVDLAKLSLWLTTLAAEHPFTFLDHSLRFGDSLVGLTRSQIVGFHWEVKKQRSFGEDKIQERLERATEARKKILDARDDVPYRDQEQRLEQANTALDVVRMIGDACVSAFFDEKTKTKRNNRCDELFNEVVKWFESGRDPKFRKEIAAAAESVQSGKHSISPFHWEIEFPEVFSRPNGGFDGFVGNPPFVAGRSISSNYGDKYSKFLRAIQQELPGGADIAAHFFRRAFANLRTGGTFGLIATNTISQGDTRFGGLRFIRNQNGKIFNAKKRLRWPGQAAVVVSLVHVIKGVSESALLDGVAVPQITAYLLKSGGDENPHSLLANSGKSFQGSILYGMGFTFSDSANPGFASPTSLMRTLIKKDPRNQERIFPFLGGDEVNNNVNHEHERFVIYMGEMSEDEARKWPDLMNLLELQVKPDRATKAADVAEWPWWQFWRIRPALYESIKNLETVLVINCGACPHMAFAFVPTESVFAHSLDVFTHSDFGAFCVLQSRVHEVWARREASSMKDDLRYTPTDCYETFPFPIEFQSNSLLSDAGSQYHEKRAAILQSAQAGLTKTYNLFHDPDENSEGILELRRLHGLMDEAVLRAYGWDDLAESASCEFLLDYEEEEDESSSSRRRKPYRNRWPEEFRDDVLARLLVLNEQRHKAELLAGQVAAEAEKKKPKPKKESNFEKGRASNRQSVRWIGAGRKLYHAVDVGLEQKSHTPCVGKRTALVHQQQTSQSLPWTIRSTRENKNHPGPK